MLGVLGGLYELLLIFGKYIVDAISDKIFKNSMLSELYCFDEDPKETNEEKDQDTGRPIVNGVLSVADDKVRDQDQQVNPEEVKDSSSVSDSGKTFTQNSG